MGQGLVQHRGVWSSPGSPALLGTRALLLGPPRSIAQPLGSVGAGAFLELLLPPVRVPGVQTIPIFLRQIPELQNVAGRTHGPLSSPHVPLGRERGPAVCASGCQRVRPGWGAAEIVLSAPPPFPAVFKTTIQGRSAAHRCQPPSCEIFAFFISNEHVSNTMSISKHGKVCFGKCASRESGAL